MRFVPNIPHGSQAAAEPIFGNARAPEKRRLRGRLGALAQYLAVLHSPADLLRYARLRARFRAGNVSGPPVRLRLRALGGRTVLCRPSRDVFTFKHTFLSGFHRAPVTLPSRPVILDLGCNVGYTIADLAHRHPDARIIGVELDEANIALAALNTAAAGGHITLVRAAIWPHDGVVSYTGVHDDAYRVMQSGNDAASRTAPAIRIESLLAEHDIARVDYVKMDIEGAEAAVVAEPAEWLDAVGALKIELHPPATLDGIRQVLAARGFDCWVDARHPNCICAVRPDALVPNR